MRDGTKGWSCIIPGKPIPQPRPRIVRRGPHARAVSNHGPVVEWKAVASEVISEEWSAAGHCAPVKGPCVAVLSFIFPRPRSRPSLLTGKLRPSVEVWRSGCRLVKPTAHPDLDNLIKPVLDVCQDVGVLENDGQVVWVAAGKWYAGVGESPHTLLTLRMWTASGWEVE